MTLRLWIENVDRLPDGGPLRIEVKGRGLDIGRDAHLDWTLPDPSRSISSKHCEIRYRDGGYWLHDVSTNGTYVNGAQYRLDAPYRLRDGDRLGIGPFIIAVEVEGRGAPNADGRGAGAFGQSDASDVWSGIGEAAAPDDRSAYRTAAPREPPPDFLDFASFIPPSEASAGPEDWLAAAPPAGDPPLRAEPAPPPRPRLVTPLQPPLVEAPPRHPTVRPSQEPPSPSTAGSDASKILRRIANAAGVPEQAIAAREPDALADEIGLALRLTAQNLQTLLSSRAESKTLMRSSSRTMIRSMNNNPLKFTGTVEEALTIMLGPPTRQYLNLQATLEESFQDLKTHQLLTYGAMQGALDALFDDLAPDRIDRSAPAERGLGALVVSRKAKLWDLYVERWRAKAKRSDGRLFEAFISLFAEAYDRLQGKG